MIFHNSFTCKYHCVAIAGDTLIKQLNEAMREAKLHCDDHKGFSQGFPEETMAKISRQIVAWDEDPHNSSDLYAELQQSKKVILIIEY